MCFEHGDGRGRTRAQADRPGRASGQHRGVGQGAHAARRHGPALDAAGQRRLRLWNDRAWHHEPAARRHPLPRRVEHQDDDRGRDRADGSGRQTGLRRSDLEVCRRRSRRGRDHDQPAPQDAVRPLQFHQCAGACGEPRRRSGQGVDRGRGPGHGVQAAAGIRARRRVRIQQHQLLPARPRRREDRRQAALGGLPGPPLRAARHEEHGAAGSHVEHDPRALRARLPLWQHILRAG